MNKIITLFTVILLVSFYSCKDKNEPKIVDNNKPNIDNTGGNNNNSGGDNTNTGGNNTNNSGEGSNTLHVVRFYANDGTPTMKEYPLAKGKTMACPCVDDLFQAQENRETPGHWVYSIERGGVPDVRRGDIITMGDSDIDLYAIWYIIDLKKEKQIGSTLFKNVVKMVEGVTPPSDDEWEQVWRWEQTESRRGKTCPWKENKGYYDTSQGYDSLCWAATATNILHWWMDRNKENIKRYGKFKGDVFYVIR